MGGAEVEREREKDKRRAPIDWFGTRKRALLFCLSLSTLSSRWGSLLSFPRAGIDRELSKASPETKGRSNERADERDKGWFLLILWARPSSSRDDDDDGEDDAKKNDSQRSPG